MAIDYVIALDCEPKQRFTAAGIIERIKMRERARIVVKQYRDAGDERPLTEIGFEFSRSTPDGESEPALIIVQDALDEAAELDEVTHFCKGCPANRTGHPFGCIGYISYPISEAGEAWLLNQLPVPDEPLAWLLLKQGVEGFQYDGQQIALLREQGDAYFESRRAGSRRLGEFDINANQVFEMIFNVGDIAPNHAAVLLMFFHAIDRELEASDIMHLTPADEGTQERHPFILKLDRWDDPTTVEFKEFFHALYIAWNLDVKLRLDV